MMIRAFDECVAAHRRNSPALQRTSGNAVATYFWRGFDNAPLQWDAASRRLMAYAHFRAGRACAEAND